MRYIILADDTRIDNCTDSTTSNSISVVATSYQRAGKIRDSFTDENSRVIKVYNAENDDLLETGADLILIEGCRIYEQKVEDTTQCVCVIATRNKTNEEKLNDRITDLEEAVIG